MMGSRGATTWSQAALGVTLAVLLMELIVRRVYTMRLSVDPTFGEIYAPGSTVRYALEGRGTSHWLEHGLRAHGTGGMGAPVLVLGDSFTEALQVDDDEAFPRVAERELEHAGAHVPVFNVGLSSRSVADYIALAPRYRETFGPRWAVVELREGDLTEDAWDPIKTHFVHQPDGTVRVVVVPPRRRGTVGQWIWNLRQRSMLVGFGFVRLGQFRLASANEPPMFRAGARAPAAIGAVGRDVSAADLENEMNQLAAAFEQRLVVVFIPDFRLEAPYALETPTRTFLRSYCARHGLRFVDPGDRYESMARRGIAPFGFANTGFNTGHMNRDGHAVVGEVLANELRQMARDAVL